MPHARLKLYKDKTHTKPIVEDPSELGWGCRCTAAVCVQSLWSAAHHGVHARGKASGRGLAPDHLAPPAPLT